MAELKKLNPAPTILQKKKRRGRPPRVRLEPSDNEEDSYPPSEKDESSEGVSDFLRSSV